VPASHGNPVMPAAAWRTALLLGLVTASGGDLSAQRPIPTPESSLGFPVGADYKLATYGESIRYFQALAAAAPDRIKLLQVGTTSLGRPWYLAAISTPANLARLDRLREIAQQLAHPATLTEADASRLALEGRAFVDINGGLHASEVAGAQHTIQLGYDLVRGSPAIDSMLAQVVVLLWPSLNPDGQDIVADWYRANVGTPYEGAPLHELYQKYIGHDNNRDAYMLNVPESRVVTRTWREWEPQLIYVHHQSSPFPTRIWLPPFAEPIATETPRLMAREVNTVGMMIAQALESEGKVGATHMGDGFDAWYPGYIDYLPMLQHVVAYWTETALFRYATPYFYTLRDFPAGMRDLRALSLYASPWKGGWWRLRDAVDYMETASLATIDYAAKFRYQLQMNRYRSGREAIERYRHEPPYAYVIPREQRDPMAAVELLRRLAFNGVRVSTLSAPATLSGVRWPAGSWIIPMDQEFAPLVRQLMQVQQYPDLREFPGGPPEQPYDAAGWTLPYLMDVQVTELREPLEPAVRSSLREVSGDALDPAESPEASLRTHPVAAGIEAPRGRISGTGPALAVNPAENNAFTMIARGMAAGGTVRRATSGPARYVLSGVPAATTDRWVMELGLQAERAGVAGVPVATRVGVYRSWRASMDEGWTEWLLDQYGIGYTVLDDASIRAGNLDARFDVILLPDDSPQGMLDGHARGTVPPRYEGGLGPEGAAALDRFVSDGGTLVCFNNASAFAIAQLRLPVANVVGRLDRQAFFASGSILSVTADTTHPVMAGMPARARIFFDDSPVFTTLPGFEGNALARYASGGSALESGYLLGADRLHGYAAALDVQHGAGRVVLLGFRPQWRGQPWGTFRIVFNALLYGRASAAPVGANTTFWTAPAPRPQD